MLELPKTPDLSLKNTDNKIITGSSIYKFRHVAQGNTSFLQRGFVPGRNFLENVVDLDAAARIFSTLFSSSDFQEKSAAAARANSLL